MSKFGDPDWFSAENLAKRASAAADLENRAWGNLGELMHNMLNPEPEPGPPYVHTLVPPEPIGEDGDGNPVYPEPGPALTVLRSEAEPEPEAASSSLPDDSYWIES